MTATSATLQRTFRIRNQNSVGTCFTVDLDGRRYLVTARHVADGVESRRAVEIWHDQAWKSLSVEFVGHGPEGVDITVLAPQQLFGGTYPIELHEGFKLGEEVYFLGFPFGQGSEVGAMNLDYPVPLIKRGIVSAISEKNSIVYIDGHNNPGFSGGPVVQDKGTEERILGVISGYRYDRQRVRDDDGREGPYTYDLNTGIVVSYNAYRIRQIAADNPVGYPVRSG